MKKLLLTIAMVLSLFTLAACASNAVEEEVVLETTASGVAEENDTAEAETTEAAEVTEAVEPTKEAVKAVEATKTDEVAEATEAAKATEAATEAELSADGLAAEVDRTQIKMFEEPKTMYVQKSVNVRKGPDTKYDRVDNYGVNKEVSVLGQYGDNGWYLISFGDGQAFISNSFLAETEVDLEALRAEQEAAALAAVERERQAAQEQAQNPQPAQAPQAAPQPAQAPAGILFIGDSRCVQMQAAVGGIGSWICEGGKRYEWFEQTAIPQADPIVGKGTKVVICMGVNDPGSCGRYAALTNAKAAEWAGRGAKVYYVSVNPVWENPWVTQEQVDNFNASMPGLLSGVRWIDTASVLKANGFKLVDGLHYDTDTYVYIFNLIAGSLK